MKLGLIFTGGGQSLSDLCAVASAAENSGFAMLCMAEAWRSGWVPLTAMAAATKTINLGPYVLNAYGRSPLLAGMSAIDFDDFSGGRLKLGVGGGNRIINEQWQGIEHARVLTKMREYVTILKQMARTPMGEPMTFDGKIHHMAWTPAVEPRSNPFPVYLAAVFPAMMKVAAGVADGIAAGATLSPEFLSEIVRPQAEAAANAADRDFQELGWSTVAVTACDPDRARARQAAREAICHLYAPLPHPYYEYTMREQGFAAVADALIELAPKDLQRACEAISDECLDAIAIAGTPDECRNRLADYHGLVDELLLLNAMPPEADDALASYSALLGLA